MRGMLACRCWFVIVWAMCCWCGNDCLFVFEPVFAFNWSPQFGYRQQAFRGAPERVQERVQEALPERIHGFLRHVSNPMVLEVVPGPRTWLGSVRPRCRMHRHGGYMLCL